MKPKDPRLEETLRLPPGSREEMTRALDRVMGRLRSGKFPTEQWKAASNDLLPSRGPRWMTAAALAVAACVIVAILGGASWYRSIFGVLETTNGATHWIYANTSFGGEGGVLALRDGSTVEIRTMSDITLQRANDGVRILLNRGTVIVNAAEQRQGHLYVTTKDMTVSVVGTVFFVSARENGSRVAVIEGEVQVRKQGDSETQLRPGEQVATSPAMALLPVRDEISWSPRAEQHLAMLDKAQPAANAPAPPIDEPEWQKAAGGKLSFDSATVTRGDGRDPGAFPLTIDNVYRSTRGVFKASLPLRQYIEFAYKLSFTSEQREAWLSQVPQWVETDYFAINARAPSANPTKDQMRLMLQSLLADRFKLALHFEARQTQALALTLLSPGRLGPQMRLHSDGPPCLTKRDDSDLFPVDIDPGVWPYTCETVIFIRPGVPTERLGQEVRKVSIHNQMAAGRNVGMDVILDALMRSGSGLEFPVVDQTGLKGVFDFSMEWTPEPGSPLAKLDTTERTPDFVPTVLSEALRDQLGMKLEATRTAVPTLIIDHVERAE